MAPAQTGAGRRIIGLPGLRRRIALTGADAVADDLAAVLNGWTPVPAEGNGDTLVAAARGGFTVQSEYFDTPMTGLAPASAVCAVIADLAQAWADERPGHLSLHAGAVLTGAGLAVVTGPARAGKSTLIARAGLEPGWQVFCDDVLPVAPDGNALALGIQPRLRLPVPAAAGPQVQALAARHCTLRDDRYGYVALPNLAPHGATAPLRIVIQLDRRPDAPPRLHALPGTETVRLLLSQAISGGDAVPPRLMRLAARVRGLRLVYSALEPAMDLLRRVLASPQALATADLAPPLPEPVPEVGPDPLSPHGMGLTWRRLPGPVPRRLRDGLALWSPTEGRGLALNQTGAALWHMLSRPVTGWEMAETLCAVFPDVSPVRIRADVAAMMGALVAEGLVSAQAPGSRPVLH